MGALVDEPMVIRLYDKRYTGKCSVGMTCANPIAH